LHTAVICTADFLS